MTTRALFRFAAIRPAQAEAEYTNVIEAPDDVPAPAAAGSSNDKGSSKSADKKDKSGDASLAPGAASLVRRAVRDGGTDALKWALDTLAGKGWGKGNLSADSLWASLRADLAARGPKAATVSALIDGIRIAEAQRRSIAGDPAGALAAMQGTVAIPRGWVSGSGSGGSSSSRATAAERGIVPAGMADLLVVEERLVRYQLGEISFIENVMRSERKERTWRSLNRSSTSYTLKTDESESTERDLQTTQRAEVQSEVSETLNTAMSLSAGVAISSSYGPVVTVDASVDTALSFASESSSTVSNTFAQDIVDRTVAKVSTSRTEELVQQTLRETEERAAHAFENQSTDHINGVYRWLEAVWEAQVMNYGLRMMMDFIVPEPAAIWRAAQSDGATRAVVLEEPIPLDLESALGITEENYGEYVARYDATGVAPPPAATVWVSKVIPLAELEHKSELGKDFVVSTASGAIAIPAGYVAVYVDADLQAQPWTTATKRVAVEIAGASIELYSNKDDSTLNRVIGPLEYGVYTYDMIAGVLGLEVKCERTAEALAEWQLRTFEAIAGAYRLTRDAYLAAVAEAEATAAATVSTNMNSSAKRTTERDELKRGALTLLSGSDFSDRDAMSGPTASRPIPRMDITKAMAEGGETRFLEHAFEWDQLTYSFYPYFWGRQSTWFDSLRTVDGDSTFEAFLRAGSARVQVPIRPEYEAAVIHYLETGLPWNGGHAPIIGDPLYVAMVDEVIAAKGRSLTNPTPFGDPWQYTLPTSLVMVKDGAPDLGL